MPGDQIELGDTDQCGKPADPPTQDNDRATHLGAGCAAARPHHLVEIGDDLLDGAPGIGTAERRATWRGRTSTIMPVSSPVGMKRQVADSNWIVMRHLFNPRTLR
jgi:hypothetical protein